jgi:hypothetical protein
MQLYIRNRPVFVYVMVLCVCVFIAGCGDGINLGTVTGVVTKDGKPQPKLYVEFFPAAGGRPAEAITDREGRFELVYTPQKKGTLVGSSNVRISIPGKMDASGDEITPRQPLKISPDTVEVKGGSNSFNFEVN